MVLAIICIISFNSTLYDQHFSLRPYLIGASHVAKAMWDKSEGQAKSATILSMDEEKLIQKSSRRDNLKLFSVEDREKIFNLVVNQLTTNNPRLAV